MVKLFPHSSAFVIGKEEKEELAEEKDKIWKCIERLAHTVTYAHGQTVNTVHAIPSQGPLAACHPVEL